jgi:hypothetical protein
MSRSIIVQKEQSTFLSKLWPYSKSASITFTAAVHRIHCSLFVLQAQILCGSHPVYQKHDQQCLDIQLLPVKLSGLSDYLVSILCCDIMFQNHTETSKISSVTMQCAGLTSLNEVFISCDSSHVAHPCNCVQRTSQVVTLYSCFSSMRFCGTNFITCSPFLFPIHATVCNKLHKL